MRSLVFSLRNLRSADIQYMTVPARGTGMEGAQSVVYLDSKRCQVLWAAVRDDLAAQWLASYPAEGTPASVG